MSHNFIQIAINEEVSIIKLLEFHFKNGERFNEGNSQFSLGDRNGYVNIFFESFDFFVASRIDNMELVSMLRDRFENRGIFIVVIYSGLFGNAFMEGFVNSLYINYKNIECIVLEDISDKVYELDEFYSIWKRFPFFWTSPTSPYSF